MQKIVLVVRGEVNVSPTVSNYLSSFLKQGYEVHCICSSVKNRIENVIYHEVGVKMGVNPLSKLLGYFLFGKRALRVTRKLNLCKNDLLWVSRIDTALCIGKAATDYNSVLALHELHDAYFFWQKITQRVIFSYKQVVYNELNRAQIARVKYSLDKLPNIIPNKPSEHPLCKNIQIKAEDLDKTIRQLQDKKIIIYQGSLQSDRSIEELVKASSNLDESFVLLIMGKDPEGKIPKFKKINEKLVYIPWVIPPDHLNITSHAHIGVAFYDTDCLNSIYCAPNKIWEYSGFGIPVLGQDIPGLINTVESHNYGCCVDINDEVSILNAINEIDRNYKNMSENALSFYHSVNFDLEVSKVLERCTND